MTIALFPDSYGGVRIPRRTPAVFIRRRLAVGLLALGLIIAIGVSAGAILADRGGVPASTPAIRPVNPVSINPVHINPVIIQPGDTMWSLAEAFHGRDSVADYVDALVAANGGPSLQVGQLLVLP